jgi:hypothetical protein
MLKATRQQRETCAHGQPSKKCHVERNRTCDASAKSELTTPQFLYSDQPQRAKVHCEIHCCAASAERANPARPKTFAKTPHHTFTQHITPVFQPFIELNVPLRTAALLRLKTLQSSPCRNDHSRTPLQQHACRALRVMGSGRTVCDDDQRANPSPHG